MLPVIRQLIRDAVLSVFDVDRQPPPEEEEEEE